MEVKEAGPGEGLHISFWGNEGVWNESQVTLINEVSNITDFTEHYRCKQMNYYLLRKKKNGKCFQSSQRVS